MPVVGALRARVPQIMDDSGFWRFSLSFYGDGQVADACLLLKDEAAADVNMLLFMLWRATQRRLRSAPEIAAIDQAVSGWRAEVVGPLRGVRRWLKRRAGPVATGEAEALRQQVKRIELEAERLQQEAMAAPIVPAFDQRPQSLDDGIDPSVGRLLRPFRRRHRSRPALAGRQDPALRQRFVRTQNRPFRLPDGLRLGEGARAFAPANQQVRVRV